MPTPSEKNPAIHVLLIHQAYVGPDEPGGTRHYEFARRLPALGVRVTVIASDRSYLSGESLHRESTEEYEGVRVVRVKTSASLHRSYVSRVLNFLRFSLGGIWKGLRAPEIDLVWGTSPQLPQAVAAWVVAFLRNKPFLLEVRDLWPEFAIDMGVLKNKFAIALARWLERFLYSRADHILVNSPGYTGYLVKHGVSTAKISLIPNGVDATMFTPDDPGAATRKAWGLEERFVVLYAGAIGEANDIGTLLDAARQVQQDDSIGFLIVGDGKERARLEELAVKNGLSNVKFTGTQPKSSMPGLIAAADLCVAVLKDIPMFRTTYPNKVFDYMAAGRPTLLAIDGVIREVIEKSGGGEFVQPGDAKAMAAAILRLKSGHERLRKMGGAARAYVSQHFDRDRHARRLAEIVHQMVPRHGS